MYSWKHKALARIMGEYCCRNDQNLTLESDAAELAGLFGYTSDEFRTVHQNSMMQFIEADVRETIRQELREQLAAGDDLELIVPVSRKDGKIIWVLNRGYRVTGPQGDEYLAGILVDITYSKHRYDVEKQMTRFLEDQAKKDSLTQIYNAQTTRQLAEAYLAEETEELGCALLILDLDDFKQINDQYGHMFGDEVLIQVAQTIQKQFRSKDIVGRIGGEEFLILMKDVTDQEIVNMRCRQLNAAVHEIWSSQLTERPLSCSIGVAFAPVHGKTYFELYHCADQALYLAKDLGKDQYTFYDPNSVRERKGKYANHFADFR